MNDLDLRLEVVSRSCQPLREIRRWISRKLLEIEAWFQRTTNRKWHGLSNYQMVTWPITSRDPRRCCEAVRSAILATAWLLVINPHEESKWDISLITSWLAFSQREHYSARFNWTPEHPFLFFSFQLVWAKYRNMALVLSVYLYNA